MELLLAALVVALMTRPSLADDPRSIDVSQEVYLDTFSQSVSNLLSSLHNTQPPKSRSAFNQTSTKASQKQTTAVGGFSVGIAAIAAIGAGLAALVAFVV